MKKECTTRWDHNTTKGEKNAITQLFQHQWQKVMECLDSKQGRCFMHWAGRATDRFGNHRSEYIRVSALGTVLERLTSDENPQ